MFPFFLLLPFTRLRTRTALAPTREPTTTTTTTEQTDTPSALGISLVTWHKISMTDYSFTLKNDKTQEAFRVRGNQFFAYFDNGLEIPNELRYKIRAIIKQIEWGDHQEKQAR